MNEKYSKNNILLILANGPSVSNVDLPKLFSSFNDICVLNAAIFHLGEFPRPPDFCFINDSSLCQNKTVQELMQNEKPTKIILQQKYYENKDYNKIIQKEDYTKITTKNFVWGPRSGVTIYLHLHLYLFCLFFCCY